jgi:hypothetical protein
MVAAKNPKYSGHAKEVNVLTAKNVEQLNDARAFLKKYALDHMVKTDHMDKTDHGVTDLSSDKILAFAAKNMPHYISDGTSFEQPKLRVVRQNERVKTEREQWMEFLASALSEGEKEIMSIELEDENGVKCEQLVDFAVEAKMGNSKLSFEEFGEYALEALQAAFSDTKYSMEKKVSEREGQGLFDAIIVTEKRDDGEVTRRFAVEPYYNDYSLGKPREDVVSDMIKTIDESAAWMDEIDFRDLSEFEKVKDRLIVRPLNYQANISTLCNHMYRRVGDVALVIYAVLVNGASGLATTKIDRKTIAEWNLSESDLFDLALDNAAKMFKPYLVPMDVIINGIAPEDYPAENKFFMEPGFKLEESRSGSYNLFAENNINAATVAFYKGALKRLSDILDDDLYVVLASMSHAVVHPQSLFALRGLRQTAKNEKRNPYADPAEFLSDRVYLYSRKDDSFDVAQ